MALNPNQFGITPVVGQMGLLPPRGIVGCEIDTSQSGTLVYGQAVKLIDSGLAGGGGLSGVPKVVGCTSNSDLVFGFIPFNFKDVSYAALAKVEIATMHDDVMYLVATAAIARGALVSSVPGTVGGVQTAAHGSGLPICGWAYDKAVNVGDLIRVVLQLPAYFNA